MTIDTFRMIQFLQGLVGTQSPPGQENHVVRLAASEMRALGFDQVFTDRNGSLIGIINGARPGSTILLDAHCDTVGIAPGLPWRSDPFSPTIENGRMYGRGTSDMKGALAAMIYAAAGVERPRLAGRVAVSVTVLEEVMEGYALGDVMAEVKPDFVVIGEATDLNLNHGGRGRAEIQLEAIGRPAHSSTPQLGINAVLKLLPALQAINLMALPADPLLGAGIMALTDTISDPYPGNSVIPSRCRATYDRRVLPGETIDSVVDSLRALPELDGINVNIAQGEHDTYTGKKLQGPKFFPAWKLDANHPYVRTSLRALNASGLNPGLGAYKFCTNAAYSAGVAGVPTIGFGPSTEAQAHVVDEYIELAFLDVAARGYKSIVEHVLQ